MSSKALKKVALKELKRSYKNDEAYSKITMYVDGNSYPCGYMFYQGLKDVRNALSNMAYNDNHWKNLMGKKATVVIEQKSIYAIGQITIINQ